MVRTHTLVEYRLKEFELEQALRKLKKQQESLDYKLDVEFYLKLETLAKEHGYSLSQVYDLLASRWKRVGRGVADNNEDLSAKTNIELLEMIQRIGVTSDSSTRQSITTHTESVQDGDRAWQSSGDRGSDAQRGQTAPAGIVSHEDKVREKISE